MTRALTTYADRTAYSTKCVRVSRLVPGDEVVGYRGDSIDTVRSVERVGRMFRVTTSKGRPMTVGPGAYFRRVTA